MIKMLGFDSDPEYIVLWFEGGKPRYKTICYNLDDVKDAIDSSKQQGSFHYGRKYVVKKKNAEEGVVV